MQQDEPGATVERAPDTLRIETHITELAEQGPFVVATCSCGWRSYARRSRPLARTEANEHALLHSPAS